MSHGREAGKHPELCDVCYWRAEHELMEQLYANTISRVEAANVHLQDQLASANKHKSDWRNMYQETYDELSSVQQAILVETARIKTAWREIATLEQQLAEARAEIERLNSVDNYACALCPDVAQARQDAAREILTEIEKYYVGGKHDYYHITTEDLIGMIKAKFGLGGVRDE